MHVIKGVKGGSPGNRPEQKGVGSSESTAIWTPRVVLYPKIPLVFPANEENRKIMVLRTTPPLLVCVSNYSPHHECGGKT